MCVDTLSSCLIRYHEARPLFLTLTCPLSLSPTCHRHSFYLLSFHLIPAKKTQHVHLKATFFFFLHVQKRKMIQTIGMSTYQLLVVISSRLPQPQIGLKIKYKTEPRADCIWMPIPFHEIHDCFWHGISRGPSFMYILRFMKSQHMMKVDNFGTYSVMKYRSRRIICYFDCISSPSQTLYLTGHCCIYLNKCFMLYIHCCIYFTFFFRLYRTVSEN